VASLRNGTILYMCQPIVNEYPWYPTKAHPNTRVATMHVVESWGDPWVEKPITLDVPPWIAALGGVKVTPQPLPVIYTTLHIYKYGVSYSEGVLCVKLDDPTLWQDSHGYFHVLSHNGDGPHPCGSHGAQGLAYRDGNTLPVGCSAHLYSRDGLNWTMSPVAAHNATVMLSGGGQRELYRQRPKVLVNERGDIEALFGGVMPCGEAEIRGPGTISGGPPVSKRLGECTSNRPPKNPRTDESLGAGRAAIVSDPGQDNCWTSVVPLATGADRSE
jgi:hypothetical protein